MKKPISNLDLNLLLCLQLLLQERSVTKAAKRMNVTPSAVSKSLGKLRDWFDDPLFVKTPLGLLPTPLTVSLEQDWRTGCKSATRSSTNSIMIRRAG